MLVKHHVRKAFFGYSSQTGRREMVCFESELKHTLKLTLVTDRVAKLLDTASGYPNEKRAKDFIVQYAPLFCSLIKEV